MLKVAFLAAGAAGAAVLAAQIIIKRKVVIPDVIPVPPEPPAAEEIAEPDPADFVILHNWFCPWENEFWSAALFVRADVSVIGAKALQLPGTLPVRRMG